MTTNSIVRDYALRDLIERLENACYALDATWLFEDPTLDELRDLTDDAANVLHAAMNYLIDLREERLRS
jgi:hypothetical protein